MPVWVAPRPQNLGFSQISIKKALSKGLTFRPVGNTAQATLEWFKKQPAERQAKMRAGLSAEREAEVLAAWHATQKS
jgi:2'-hydroxyisoflavone reductase